MWWLLAEEKSKVTYFLFVMECKWDCLVKQGHHDSPSVTHGMRSDNSAWQKTGTLCQLTSCWSWDEVGWPKKRPTYSLWVTRGDENHHEMRLSASTRQNVTHFLLVGWLRDEMRLSMNKRLTFCWSWDEKGWDSLVRTCHLLPVGHGIRCDETASGSRKGYCHSQSI